MTKQIPNKHPIFNDDSGIRIAVIGDCPSNDDATFGEPFIGPQGHLLKNLLASAQINASSCLLANTCQFVPPYGNLKRFATNGAEMQISLQRLREDINKFNPNLIILLGEHALKIAGETSLTVSAMRGTFFIPHDANSPFYNRKCLITHHPNEAIRNWDFVPLIRLDFERARAEGRSPTLTLPKLKLDVHLTTQEICEKLAAIKDGNRIALDIEGDVNNITCLSIATSRNYAFAIDLRNSTLDEEVTYIRALHRVLNNPKIGKILQHSLYDNFALSYRYKLLIRNVCWDTMLSGWEIYPELPKALGTQTSIWTKHPAYKHERTIKDWTVHLEYCCKDSCITYEIAEEHERVMTPAQLQHFKFNMDMLAPLLYMQLRGIRYNTSAAKLIHDKTNLALKQINDRISQRAGYPVNVNSPKQLSKLLYKDLKFPPQYKKEAGRNTNKLTTGIDALLTLRRTNDHPILTDILSFRNLEKIRTYTEITTDSDGRVRCAYNVVGTDTGRLSCNKSPTGSGANLTTITKKLRHLYQADNGYGFFQVDLAGADGWTVAAHCARGGDRTMLDDYHFGIKPAKVIALLHTIGPEVNSWSREKILAEGRDIGKGDTEQLYFACKRVQHGTNYLLGVRTMSMQLLKDGYKYLGKLIYVSESACKELQRLYLIRYPGVKTWQYWVASQLYDHGVLSCASGHIRRFFGRRNDHKTKRDACAHEPQANTTYATNLAILRLWQDPENRNPDGSLIIEPLHQVHDAALGQFPLDRADWAVEKLRSYFDNEVTIAGNTIRIPFDGGYGASWGDTDDNSGTPIGYIS